MTSSVETLKARFEEELGKFKQLERGSLVFVHIFFFCTFMVLLLPSNNAYFADREKNISNRQQLEGQLTENNLVKTVSILYFFNQSYSFLFVVLRNFTSF